MTKNQRRSAKSHRFTSFIEAGKSLWTWRFVTVPLVIMVGIVTGIYTGTTIDTVTTAQQQAVDKNEAGRYVLTLAQGDQDVGAHTCERIRNLDGVHTSFAISDGYTHYTLDNKVSTIVTDVSPGFIDYVNVAPHVQGATASPAFVGADIAERAGVTKGTKITGAPAGQTADTAINRILENDAILVPKTSRTGLNDDLIANINATNFPARHCLVEAVPAAVTDVAASLPSFISGVQAEVGPYDEVLESDRGPETALSATVGGPVAWMGGGLLTLLPLTLWFIRRAEWALFSAFGVTFRWLISIGTIEWLLLIGVPVLAGAGWGVVATLNDASWLGYKIAIFNTGAMATLGLLALPLWILFLKTTSVLQALKE